MSDQHAEFVRITDPAHERRCVKKWSWGQQLRELTCSFVGHKPRRRTPFQGHTEWAALICGRCGQYPCGLRHNPRGGPV